MSDDKIKCAVVGAGPVGALAALYAARRGYEVDVYELRGGMSAPKLVASETGINTSQIFGMPQQHH